MTILEIIDVISILVCMGGIFPLIMGGGLLPYAKNKI